MENEQLVQVCFLKLKGLNGGRGQYLEVRRGLSKMDVGELQSLNQLLLSAEQQQLANSRNKFHRKF